ncbi:NETI motif-containing protein [Bacillus sp. CGMCC 1.60114]|uniref:NETI motif-containing protein n=1 Tax=unclassified Bacillus (in: firmicutes) TaxID=185979 RepID=UPI00363BF09B
MTKQLKKKKFEVLPDETIAQCLERMEKEGYTPSRRMEEPIFHEVKREGEIVVEPCGRKIIFEGKVK